MLDAVLGDVFEPGTSFALWLLLDPAAGERILNGDDFARAAVGGLRYETGQHPQDRRLTELVAELRDRAPYVARWWDDQSVTD
ncbi:hypothetical protein M1L60_45915 [Actinoplanes sp. TRM 88003]|uniref:MmyB-like transcription regulator ligand binding domain-containing protein n=1 Tax=Paractinoplanes aksuensis TaxID=2939490 RepID=A0ABT1E4Z7_9ACTN|nr:hypothetical protein [Actinoplanes aksuensis]MCO8277933.1 hypothetical protein [Actinoplanes aksuensis]